MILLRNGIVTMKIHDKRFYYADLLQKILLGKSLAIDMKKETKPHKVVLLSLIWHLGFSHLPTAVGLPPFAISINTEMIIVRMPTLFELKLSTRLMTRSHH